MARWHRPAAPAVNLGTTEDDPLSPLRHQIGHDVAVNLPRLLTDLTERVHIDDAVHLLSPRFVRGQHLQTITVSRLT